MENITLPQLQDYCYSILCEFDRVCRKFGIQYSLEGGSLLGAVKYGGFVPWDDDIDVIMLRENYIRFIQVAPDELNKDFFLQSYENVPVFPLNYAKLCLNGTEYYEYPYSGLKMHHGIFIDIFPIDNVEKSNLSRQLSFISILTRARKIKVHLPVNIGKFKYFVSKTLSLLPMRTLCRLITKACMWNQQKAVSFRYEVCNSNTDFPPLPASVYDKTIDLRFRDGYFQAIAEYDIFLKTRFGKNYMDELPPIEKRIPSHGNHIRLYKDGN